MLEVTRFYFKGNPITLYFAGTPNAPVPYHALEIFFAVELTEVLIALGLLSPEPTYSSEYEECSEWRRERALALRKYSIPSKMIMMSDENYVPGIFAEFRHIVCLDGVLPECDRWSVFNLSREIEESVNLFGSVMNKHFTENSSRFTRTNQTGGQEEQWVSCISPAEYIRFMQTALLERQTSGGNRIWSRMKEDHLFMPESELAKELGTTQPKLRDSLVKSGLLEKQQTGLKSSYEPTKIGTGYCCDRKGRKWHKSVIALLTHAG